MVGEVARGLRLFGGETLQLYGVVVEVRASFLPDIYVCIYLSTVVRCCLSQLAIARVVPFSEARRWLCGDIV
jgi:hypothetical protein